jgi:transposase
MKSRPQFYVPQCLRVFQGFFVKDIKEWRNEQRVEILLEHESSCDRRCHRCQGALGVYHSSYKLRAKHLKMMGWQVEVVFFREKRFCQRCKKIRAEHISWLCPSNPHVTMELAWWLNRLTEITSVLAVSRLESVDKKACYQVDKYILRRILQGYKIPSITKIAVDEVYARSKKQLKEGENRDDLFLTIIVDLKTRKVIWVSQSRRKKALDEFFELIGKEACEQIRAVATDQHEDYGASVRQHCPHATLVWDRFHLTQNFNEALNEDRREELERLDPEGSMGDLINGKYRHIFLTKASQRTSKDQRHIEEVARLNDKMAKIEIIKEHFHQVFDCGDEGKARVMLAEIYDWAMQAKAWNIWKWIKTLREQETFYNYFKFRITTGLSEGINRVIKGLKWQAYGYKDMAYFALKILQKCGYLNSKYHKSENALIWSSN